jgi:chemosensory pili system protein ChpC
MNDSATTVRCMLLPVSSIHLLIPNSAVAEIVGYSTPRSLAGSSDWFAGVVLWRGVYVPVVAVEEMCEIDSAHVGPRARIAILYNPSKDVELPYLGIQIQDIPRAYLAEADKMETGTDDDLSQYLLSRVDDDQLARFIPDLEAIITTLKLEYSPDKLNQLTH